MKATDILRSSKSKFFIQWHITEQCNWRCRHCYQETRAIEDLPFESLSYLFYQCLDLFRILNTKPGLARINLCGGEPFIRKDFFDLLSLFSKYDKYLSVGILTNGSFINRETARDLSRLKFIRSIQVSLEGLQESNDSIRGKGAFAKTIKAIEILREYKIPAVVSMTVTRSNASEIEPLAVYLKEIGVSGLGARRYVPLGRGKALNADMLSPQELREFYLKREELQKKLYERGKFHLGWGCEDGVLALEFSPERREVMLRKQRRCAVVENRGFTLFTNADVYACRRFPKSAGNALKKSLSEIYLFSRKLWSFRDKNNAHLLCKQCPVFKYCLGGAKCIIDPYFKTPFAPDPQCWRLFKKLPFLKDIIHDGKDNISLAQ